MKIIVLTCKSEEESAKQLGYETSIQLKGNKEDYYNTMIIRWGNSHEIFTKNFTMSDFPNVITDSNKIKLNCNKPKALKKLSEVVLTPKVYEVETPKEKCVIRQKNHSKGKEFKVEKGPVKLGFFQYATKFIKSDLEVRVWYFNDKLMCARRITKSKKELKSKFKCRSLWTYRFWKNLPPELEIEVIKAIKHLGFDYGAFDILYKDGQWIFLENNTAPQLDTPKIIRFYRNGMKKLLPQKIKEARAELHKNPPFELEYKIRNFVSPGTAKKTFDDEPPKDLIAGILAKAKNIFQLPVLNMPLPKVVNNS